MLEDYVIIVWLFLCLVLVVLNFFGNRKIKSFIKETKNNFIENLNNTAPRKSFFSSQDSVVLFLYINMRKYRLADDVKHIKDGDYVFKISMCYFIIFTLCSAFTIFIALL